jgi:hypothetical protein
MKTIPHVIATITSEKYFQIPHLAAYQPNGMVINGHMVGSLGYNEGGVLVLLTENLKSKKCEVASSDLT